MRSIRDPFALERVLEETGQYDEETLLWLTAERGEALKRRLHTEPWEVCQFCGDEYPTDASLETHIEWEHA